MSSDLGLDGTAGCGMCAMPLKGLYKDDIPPDKLRRVQGNIKRNIPTGPVLSSTEFCHAVAMLPSKCFNQDVMGRAA